MFKQKYSVSIILLKDKPGKLEYTSKIVLYLGDLILPPPMKSGPLSFHMQWQSQSYKEKESRIWKTRCYYLHKCMIDLYLYDICPVFNPEELILPP